MPANLASSKVSIVKSWSIGGPSHKAMHARIVRLTDVGAGGADYNIRAVDCKLDKIIEASPLVKSDNVETNRYCVKYDGSGLWMIDSSSNNIIEPIGEGTYTFVVKGFKS